MDDGRTLLGAVYIELDPILDGFEGVLVELSRDGDDYILTETASSTGNLILRFTSKDRVLAYKLFREQISVRPC